MQNLANPSGGMFGAVAGPMPPMVPQGGSEMAQILANLGRPPIVSVTPPSGGAVVPAPAINTTAVTPSERQLQVAGVGNVLRILYGSVRIGADLALIRFYGGSWYILAVWGKGPISAVRQVWVNDAAPDASCSFTHYTGTATQTANVALQVVLAAEGKVYADALHGVAYTVAVIPADAVSGFPTLAALIDGRLLYDPRLDDTNGGTGSQRLADSTTWTFSTNPELSLADFRAQLLGRSLDWSTVAAVANECDELLGVDPSTEKRRTLALSLDRAQSPVQWTDTLRTYAGCMVIPDAGGEKHISLRARHDALLTEDGDSIVQEGTSDRLLLEPASAGSEMSFNHSNIVAGSLRWKKRGIQQVPRYVEVQFTDTGTVPYIAGFATALATGLTWATAAPSKINLSGITRYSQAYREAVERLNQFLLNDLSVTFTSHDESALMLQTGTLIDVTSTLYGWSGKLFRVDAAPALASGQGIARYVINASEYDPAVYSDAVVSLPTTPDTTLDTPTNPPAITGLTVAEEAYLEQFAVIATQARLTWTRPSFVFPFTYWVTADIDGVRQWETYIQPSGNATDEAVVPRLRPGELYSFGVAVKSSVAVGARTFIGLRPLGKSNPPSNVTSISGFSVDGAVFLDWTEATDDDQIHIRYELRYGGTGGTWETASSIQKIAALHYQVPGIPVGSWRFWVKAIDSIGQESASAAYIDLTVTDTGPLAVTEFPFVSPSTAQMVRNDIATQADPRWLSDNGDVMGYGHVDTTDATGVFVDANVLVGDLFVTPRTVTTSSWTSETVDFGAIVMASWAASLPYRALIGAVTFNLYLSPDNAVWTPHLGGIALNVAARYAYIEAVNTASGDVFSVDGYGLLQVVQAGNPALRPTAVTTETVTPDTTVTITISGTDYKLVAKVV